MSNGEKHSWLVSGFDKKYNSPWITVVDAKDEKSARAAALREYAEEYGWQFEIRVVKLLQEEKTKHGKQKTIAA